MKIEKGRLRIFMQRMCLREFIVAMIEFGIDDGETADLELHARRHMKLILDWMAN